MCLCLTTSLLQTTVQPAVVKAPTLGWSQLIYAPIQRSLSENPTVFYMCFGSTSTVLWIKYSVMKRLYCLAFRLIQLSNDVVIAWIASSVKRSVTCVATTHEKQSLLGCETFSPLVPKILPLKFFFFQNIKRVNPEALQSKASLGLFTQFEPRSLTEYNRSRLASLNSIWCHFHLFILASTIVAVTLVT